MAFDGEVRINTKLDNAGIIKGIHEAGKHIAGLTKDLEKTEQAIREQTNVVADLEGKYRAAATAADLIREKVGGSSAEFTEAAGKADALSGHLDKAQNKLAGMTDKASLLTQSIVDIGQMGFVGFAEQANLAQMSIAAAESRIQSLNAQLATETKASSIIALKNDIAAAGQSVDTFKSKLSKPVADIMGVKRTETELQGLKEKLASLQAGQAAATNPIEKMGFAASINNTKNQIGTLEAELERLKTVDVAPAAHSVENVGTQAKKSSLSVSDIGNAAKRIGSTAAGVFSRMVSGIKGIATHAAKAAKGILGIGKSSNAASSGVDKLISRIKSIVVTVAILSLVRKALTKLKDDMLAVLATNADFAASWNAVRANLLTAFAPLWGVIQPAIITFMGLMARFASVLAQFMAVLFGKTYQQAKDSAKAMNDQAKGFDKVAAAAKKASTVIDEFNYLEQPDSGAGVGGGAGTAVTPPVDFGAVEPPDTSWLDDLIAKFAILYPAEDKFFHIGAALGESVSTAIAGIDWAGLEARATETTSNITSLLNGIVVGANWDAMGASVAAGLNTVFAAVGNLITTFNWAALGSAVATGLNSLFAGVKWDTIGATISGGLNALLSGLSGFITSFNWKAAAASLAKGLNSITKNFNWKKLGKTLGDGINGVFGFVYTFMTTYDWGGLGESVALSLNELFTTVDWGLIGRTLATKFTALVDFLYSFVTTFDWVRFGFAIGDAINGFFDEIDWEKVGQTISTGIAGALSTLGEAIKTIDWVKIGQDISALLGSIDWGAIATELFTLLGNALGGLGLLLWGVLQDAFASIWDHFDSIIQEVTSMGRSVAEGILWGILTGLANIGQWLIDNVFKPIWDGFCEMFGIHSPSTVMAELGIFIMEGLLNGIQSLWQSIVDFFAGLLANIQEIFAGIGQWFSDRWEDIKTAFSTVAEWFSTVFTGAWEGIKIAFSAVKTWFTARWNDIVAVFGAVGEWFSNIFTGAWNGVKTAFSTVKQWFTDRLNDIKGVFSGIKEWFSTIFSNALGAVKTVWQNVSTWFRNTVLDPIQSGFKAAINAILGFAEGFVNFFIGGLNGMLKGAIDILNGFILAANLIPGVDVPEIKAPKIPELKIPRLAKGGIVDSATIAMIGERGREAVVPLENNMGWMRPIVERLEALLEETEVTNSLLRQLIEVSGTQDSGSGSGSGDNRSLITTFAKMLLPEFRSQVRMTGRGASLS